MCMNINDWILPSGGGDHSHHCLSPLPVGACRLPLFGAAPWSLVSLWSGADCDGHDLRYGSMLNQMIVLETSFLMNSRVMFLLTLLYDHLHSFNLIYVYCMGPRTEENCNMLEVHHVENIFKRKHWGEGSPDVCLDLGMFTYLANYYGLVRRHWWCNDL